MPTEYDRRCTAVYIVEGIQHITRLTCTAVYRDETIEYLLREMQPSARLISTEWERIPKWIAKPTGDTIRHQRAMSQAGFRWDGCDWSMISPTKPPRPWGCKVYRYRQPAPPRKGFGAAIGIMGGTHDEFGRPLQQQQERKRTMTTGIANDEMEELADLFASLESAQDALACVRRELDAAWQAWRDATDGGDRAEIAETQRTIGRLSVAHMHARETLQEQVREARTAERG